MANINERTHFTKVSTGEGFEVNETEVIDSNGDLVLDSMAGQEVILQGDAVLDLTDATTPSKATIASSGDGVAASGADVVIPLEVVAYVTTTVAAGTTAPIVTVQDSSSNSAGLTLTLTDGDAQNDVARASASDGSAMTAVDLTSEDLEVAVTTAAADAATAAGGCKVFVRCLLVK